MTQVAIERAANAFLLIIQDSTNGKRKVISVPFEGDTPGYQAEGAAVQLLLGIVVD